MFNILLIEFLFNDIIIDNDLDAMVLLTTRNTYEIAK